MEAPVPESLSVVAFLHRWTAQLCSLSPLCSENQQDAFKTSELWFYHTDVTLPFCWILCFSLVPESPQQPVNTHHLHFSLLLHCFWAIIGHFVEIIQTAAQNWGQQKFSQIANRAGWWMVLLSSTWLMSEPFLTSLALSCSSTGNVAIENKIWNDEVYGYMKSRAKHLGTVCHRPKSSTSLLLSIPFIFMSLSSLLNLTHSSGVRTSGALNSKGLSKSLKRSPFK